MRVVSRSRPVVRFERGVDVDPAEHDLSAQVEIVQRADAELHPAVP
jgi:hypothetical protein